MSRPATPADASAALMTRLCCCTLGAVKPIFRLPSLLIALPRTTAWTASPSAMARSRRLITTAPAPLPVIMPLAAASKGRHWPSADQVAPSW